MAAVATINYTELAERILEAQDRAAQDRARARANEARAAAERARWAADSARRYGGNGNGGGTNMDYELISAAARAMGQDPQTWIRQAILKNGGGNGGVAAKDYGPELRELKNVVETLLGQQWLRNPWNGQAGQMGQYDRDAGTGNAGRLGGTPYKGGVCASDIIGTLPSNAAAGTTITGTWSGDELARLLGTTACRIQFYTFPANANGGALLATPERARVELLINGSQTQFRNVPLIRVIGNADGSEKQAVLNIRLPEFASVTWRLTVTSTLTGNALGLEGVQATIDAADICTGVGGGIEAPPNTQGLGANPMVPDGRQIYAALVEAMRGNGGTCGPCRG